MMFSTLIAVVASLYLASEGQALTPRSSYVEHERRSLDGHSSRWQRRSRIAENLVIRTRVALIPTNVELGHDLLMEISDPDSDKYGKHYTPEEIVDLFSPQDSSIESVKAWLEEQFENVAVSRNRQYLSFDATASKLGKLLDTEYYEYEHHETGKISIGCEHYSVPAHLRDRIDFITPGLTMSEVLKFNSDESDLVKRDRRRLIQKFRKQSRPLSFSVNDTVTRANQSAKKGCDVAVTPHCVRQLYNIQDEVQFTPGDGNSIGIYETELNLLSPRDLQKFLSTYAPDIPNNTFPKEFLIDGAPSPKKYSDRAPIFHDESDLDFMAVYPLVYPIPVQLFQADDSYWESAHHTGLFNTMLDYMDGSYCEKKAFGIKGETPGIDPIYPDKHKSEHKKLPPSWKHPHQCGIAKPPRVLSISWSALTSQLSSAYMRRQCQEFMKLGMQGVSIFASSGDSGIAGYAICRGHKDHPFELQALATCPYITGVGSTVLPSGGKAGKTPEIATTAFGSSGGFSPVFTRPKYQDKMIENYFKHHDPPYEYYKTKNNPKSKNVTGRYNRIGRGVPDVAAIGQHFVIVEDGHFIKTLGTSVSAPVWAGMMARINGARIAAGKSTVGFINPTLYSHPEIFTDVVEGSNPGCGVKGFDCVKGWDPVTGLGTPNYQKMKKLFMSMP